MRETGEETATESAERTGRLGIPYLYRYWRRTHEQKPGPVEDNGERDLEYTLLSGLGLNILEAARFLNPQDRPSFDALEDWIIGLHGGSPDASELARLRDALAGRPVASAAGDLDRVAGLTEEELAFWDENGYVVLHDAIAPSDRNAAAAAIYQFLDASPDEPDTWYRRKYGASIWVPLLRHPSFVANRRHPRLVKAFAQLWGREDLWPIIDQGGFNPPEREDWKFPGPHVHWDASVAAPHHLGVQGILYLTDTPADQGSFRCIPGFHRRLESWLRELPPGVNPRDALHREPGLVPIAGRAGDLILWHHLLPHASSPNSGRLPRVAQYIALRPTRWAYTSKWV